MCIYHTANRALSWKWAADAATATRATCKTLKSRTESGKLKTKLRNNLLYYYLSTFGVRRSKIYMWFNLFSVFACCHLCAKAVLIPIVVAFSITPFTLFYRNASARKTGRRKIEFFFCQRCSEKERLYSPDRNLWIHENVFLSLLCFLLVFPHTPSWNIYQSQANITAK